MGLGHNTLCAVGRRSKLSCWVYRSNNINGGNPFAKKVDLPEEKEKEQTRFVSTGGK